MKKIGVLILAAVAIMASMSAHKERLDSYVKSRVVQIVNERGSCSGEQIRTASGMDYVLTAAHCKILSKEGSYTVISEDGKKMERKEIAEDGYSDLLLLEGMPGMKGLEIAKYSYPGEHVRTQTHGHAFKTYKTEGVLIQDTIMQIPLFEASAPEDYEKCTRMPKYEVIPMDTFFGPMPVCALSVYETVMTAFIAPGSSGGPVVDDDGKLVGVVSATGDNYGFIVPTAAIHKFIDNY